ncbi:Protein of unknown function DUF1295 [Penicillium atrosanguineum]|uniref:DUF1295 domain protein n=1 Tax=Penicillium atrosanguineum TaxID=1132637 RepID=A0A9W9L322_9EURO|nr:Pyruvate/Phosphoenolpyruvate kinase [Penicillium atrosanguineum]KAJ5132302.1 Protein of unknown function DUF1295 [Penicillium atrosanguineum]KAJ5289969.1 Pyruvate/Phosphoenolpyruvate kinase [Penicillium atrosanguineum]KAJ5307791.1 Protein of unknown function DUF1295 [Penicillium atrosanguineum]
MSNLPLPRVESLVDCTNFKLTVLPYLAQLEWLPASLREAGRDLDSLKAVYLATNPFVSALSICLVLAGGFFLAAEINRNFSQVDRFWSILPALYNVHYALWARLAGIRTQTLDTIAVISILWSIRLTFNYWRKGGYSIGSEDYRWEIVRARVNNTFVFTIFNFSFIAVAQSLLLLLITVPTYVFVIIAQNKGPENFGLADLAFSRVALFFIIIEFFADQQQWNFHQAKHEYQTNARIPEQFKDQYTFEDLERGFVVSGLWSWSRHPNFVAEQAVWLTMYAWCAFRTETYASWAGIGLLGYMAIFQGSTRLTEAISASKYSEYSEYQARVGRFLPRLSVEAKQTKPAKKAAKKPKAVEKKSN